MKKNPVFNWANPNKKFIAYDLEPNEIFSAEYVNYKLDVANLKFNKIDECVKKFDKETMQKFLDANKITISVEEFINLCNLQSYIRTVWPDHDKNRPHREEIFKKGRYGKDRPMLLSEAFDKKIAASVECSLLAQMYLQHCGMESFMYCGNVFAEPNPDIRFGGSTHSYLKVRLSGGYYIYDPGNPMLDSDKRPIIPRIMSYLKVPFKDRRAFEDLLNKSVSDGGGFAYLEASDIYGVGKHWFYGFESDDEENKVRRQRTEAGMKRQVPDQLASQHIYGQGGRNY